VETRKLVLGINTVEIVVNLKKIAKLVSSLNPHLTEFLFDLIKKSGNMKNFSYMFVKKPIFLAAPDRPCFISTKYLCKDISIFFLFKKVFIFVPLFICFSYYYRP